MWTDIVQELGKYDIFEWLILGTGILYAIFSMLNKPIGWVFGIISCVILSYKDFTSYSLYFDGILQVFYVLLGIIGLYKWQFSKTDDGNPIIFSLPILSHINSWILGGLLSLILVVIMRMFLNPAYALLDSVTTVFSIWATWLLVNRVYETWVYWIIINILYIGLYHAQGATLVAVLYSIYLITAIGGLLTWKRTYDKDNKLSTINSNP